MVTRLVSVVVGVLIGLGVIASHQSEPASAVIDRDCGVPGAAGWCDR